MAELACHVSGGGPPLVLIHGWGLHQGVWAPIRPHLERHFRLYAVDLPGHGESPLAAAPFTLEGLASAVAAQVPQEALWLGWSLGGMVALAAAAGAHPPPGVVLVAAAARFVRDQDWPHGMAPQQLARFAADLEADYRGTLRRFVALQVRGAAGAREGLRQLRAALDQGGEPAPEALAGGLEILAQADLRPQLPRVRVPVLGLYGQRDMLLPPGQVEATLAGLPWAQGHGVSGAGHAPFLSHPETFVQRVLEFAHGI